MIYFAWPWMALLLLLPWLVRLLPEKRTQTAHALPLPFLAYLNTQNTPSSPIWRHHPTRLLLAWLIWILLVMAAMRPQILGEPISSPQHGRDILLLIDLSGSMQIDDMSMGGRKLSRLDAIKEVLPPFIYRRVNDRLGLIFFADAAYIQAPLTFDRNSVKQFLLDAEIGLAGSETAIGDAIGLAIKHFGEIDGDSGAMILLTDGANNAGILSPDEAAELVAQRALKIHTIGFGATEMVVSSFWSQRRVNPSSDLDEGALIHIAEKSGGRYFRAVNTDELTEIYHEIDRLEPIADEERLFRPKRELYPYPLALVALFSMGGLLSILVWNWRSRK
jgi:Ca-activated chloride channel family protein